MALLVRINAQHVRDSEYFLRWCPQGWGKPNSSRGPITSKACGTARTVVQYAVILLNAAHGIGKPNKPIAVADISPTVSREVQL